MKPIVLRDVKRHEQEGLQQQWDGSQDVLLCAAPVLVSPALTVHHGSGVKEGGGIAARKAQHS